MPSCSPTPAAFLAALALSLAGCSTSHNARSLGDAPAAQAVAAIDHDAWGKLGYRLDWQGFPFAGTVSNPLITKLTPTAQFILAQESGSHVSLLETSTGARRWTEDFGTNLTKFVGLNVDPGDPQRILVSAESELFIITAATGAITGRERFDRVVNTAPVLIDGLAIYGTSVGEVLSHRPGATLKAWGYGTNASIDANPVQMTDAVGIVTQGYGVYIFASNGTLLGRNQVFAAPTTNPVSNGQFLVIAGADQSLWCFDTRGGLVWRIRRSQPLTVQPTALENAVICDLPDLGLTAVELASGNILWSNKSVHGTVIASHNNRLLVWDGATASIVDATRGDLFTSTNLPGIKSIVPDQFANGNLYAATAEGSIAKFKPKN